MMTKQEKQEYKKAKIESALLELIAMAMFWTSIFIYGIIK